LFDAARLAKTLKGIDAADGRLAIRVGPLAGAAGDGGQRGWP